ncbi:MAG TPA: c-type cytochrome [Blastocatellia bacterium]|nr:c-type cytochrome [Blastocatellia bacterium]
MRRGGIIIGLLVVIAVLVALYAMSAQDRSIEQSAMAMTGGDFQRGKAAISNFGCGSCHTIPGIAGAEGRVGPPLQGIAGRMYIGGVLTNTPENLMRWIRDPKKIDEKTAMPVIGISESDAKDIAAYLYTLN